MRSNIVLFAILSVLMVGTYFFQEKRVEKEVKDSKLKNALILDEIVKLELTNLKAEKKHGQWFDGETLLSFNTFKQIEKKFSEIIKIKEITGDWKNFSRNNFPLKINGEDWAIGDLSLDKQSFYIKRGKKIYLAEIEGESHHLTTDGSEIAEIKLNELLSLLSKRRDELKEFQLFRYFPGLPLEQVVVTNDGDLPFELNLISNMTTPAPITGIEVHTNLKNKFMSLLTQVTLKEILPYSEKGRFKKISEINFIGHNHKLKWELWLKSQKSADAIIFEPVSKKSFLMVGGTLKVFFVRLQDYWDKKVIPQKYFQPSSDIRVTFTQGSKVEDLIIENKEPLKFVSKKFKIDSGKLEQLAQMIFNLGARDQAERVSILTKAEKRQLLSGNYLILRVINQELVLWRKTEELIVANVTQGFKAHFSLLDEKFLGTFEDMLK